MDIKYKQLAKNTVFVFIGNIGSKMITFLMLPFYTLYLTTSDYGKSDIIFTYSSITLSFVTCCIADAIFVYPKQAEYLEKKRYFSSGLFFVLCSFVLCALGSYLLSINSAKLSFLGCFVSDIWWVYFLTFSMFLQFYLQQFTLSIGKMLHYSMAGIILTLSTALFAVVLLPSQGLKGYLLSLILSYNVSSVYTFISAHLYEYLSLSGIKKQNTIQLLKYGIPIIPNSVMWWLVSGVNRPLMEYKLGLATIGIYAVASKFPSALSMLFGVVSNAWGISVIEEINKDDFRIFFNKTLKAIIFIVTLIGYFVSLFSKHIVSIFAADDYFSAWYYIPILTLGVILQSVSGFIGGIFMAKKKSIYFFYSSFWAAIVSIAFTIVGIEFLGLLGVCIAVAMSFLIMCIARFYYARQYFNKLDIMYYIRMLILYTCLIIVVMIDNFNIIFISAIILIISITIYSNRNLIRNLKYKRKL